ncbi:MAG: glycosyltransferase [Methylococcales bacterium]|nr:glycosyltransferase [Methylococcales bacterium]
MRRKIIIITNSFPFLPGEQFIESEILFWAERDDIEVTLMPFRFGNEEIRKIPENIKLDLSLCANCNKLQKLFFLAKAILNPKTYVQAYKEKSINKNLFCLIEAQASILKNTSLLEKNLRGFFDDGLVVYTYWHNNITYAFQNLKNKYNFRLVSRIHGYDLYEERRQKKYIPLKRQYSENIDVVYALTDSAREYMVQQYKYEKSTIKISRLGVIDRGIVTLPNADNIIHIVSCSYIVEVKRLDKIIQAISSLTSNKEIVWTHIGTGNMYSQIFELAKNKLKNFELLGDLSNGDVFEFYKKSKIDIFINTSESEGVPFSIMEAMSCHIPVVAPDVGGVGDIVYNNFNGKLLSSECTIKEIANALVDINFFRQEKTRKNAYGTFLKKFNSEENYKNFIKDVLDGY